MDFRTFIPHGFCLAWDPGLVWLQAASDGLIAAAYYSIPAALLVFVQKRRDLAFRPLFGLFAAFILACGTTHIFGVVTLFIPLYWTDGILKAMTAALSVATAIVLWPLIPKALALPSPAALRAVNVRLAEEVSERDQTAIRLRESEQRLRDLYAGSPAILHATDAQGTLIEVSRRWLELFGYTREEVIGRSMREFYEPSTVAGAFSDSLPVLIADQHHTTRERRLALRNGQVRDAEAVYAFEHDADGTLRHVLVALTDVTSRKEAEAALRESEDQLSHAQRIESLGQLTGGIAHDFNNLLTTIMGSLEMVEQSGQLDQRFSRMASNALEGARRGARLTSQLLSFSRRSPLAPESQDPVATVTGIAELLAKSVDATIRLHIDTASGLGIWPILADRTQLEVALLNLVINARDAVVAAAKGPNGPAHGEITISFANHALQVEQTHGVYADPIAPGDYVALTVSDNGVGMSPEVLSRALEPYFTTKRTDAGTGLGLSQIYGFAVQSGGTLRLSSRAGVGTQAEILLPRGARAMVAPRHQSQQSSPRANGDVIVLVEDDALLRHTIGEALRARGYVVETAPEGRAALMLLQTLPRVDLLFTDIMMPGGMNGIELARAARAISGQLNIMFATGYSDANVLAQWPERFDLLTKPFNLDELCSRVGARLNGAPRIMEPADA